MAEADRLHSELEKVIGRKESAEEEEGEDECAEGRMWEVTRTIKHATNKMEFEVRFGFNFFLRAYQMRLHLKGSRI